MSTTSAEAIETPKWPLLPRISTNLARVNQEKVVATGDNLHISKDDADHIPHLPEWVVVEGLSYGLSYELSYASMYPSSIVHGLYVSIDPVVIELVRCEREKYASDSEYSRNWKRRDRLQDIGTFAMIATEFFGSASGGGFLASQLPIQPWATIGGFILGAGAGVAEIFGSVGLLNRSADKYLTESNYLYNQKKTMVQESSLTYRIPRSARLSGLPEKVKRVLENDENPRQLFINTLMPNISAMVDYESRLASIVTQLAEIEERSKVLGMRIDADENTFVELTRERKEITAKSTACLEPINSRITELDNVAKVNASAARFAAQCKLHKVEEPGIINNNELREFYTSICLALETAFIPCVNEEEALSALKTSAVLITTISDTQHIGSIYEAFRGKYKASLNLPDYENLQNLIAKNREPS